MGYEVHIFRKSDYENEEEQRNISLEEWIRYVRTDSALRLTDGYSGFPDNTWYESKGFCEWIDHSYDIGDNLIWFSYGYGSISTKNPDDKTVKKMVQIASCLNAKVCDDDDRFFDETFISFDAYIEKSIGVENKLQHNVKEVTESIKSNRAWWKFW
jgi:hypothetical protein